MYLLYLFPDALTGTLYPYYCCNSYIVRFIRE